MLHILDRNYSLKIIVTLNVQFQQRKLVWLSLKKMTASFLFLIRKCVHSSLIEISLLWSYLL